LVKNLFYLSIWRKLLLFFYLDYFNNQRSKNWDLPKIRF